MNQPNSTPVQAHKGLRPYKRRARNILIHRPMQREFSMVLIALLMISTLAIGFVIHATIHEAAFGGGFHFGKINPVEVLAEVRYQLILRVSCILFATLIVIGIFGIFFLHRVAGPVYRFRQVFLRLNRGEVPALIRLREEDFFSETAEEINRLIQKMQTDAESRKFIREKADQILSQNAGDKVASLAREIKVSLEERPHTTD